MSREIGISILLSAVTPDKTPDGIFNVGKKDCRRAVLEQLNN
jgi:hypothetical protein